MTPAPSSAASTDPPQFIGRYKIVKIIGRSNDIVYEATDPAMNRRVAVKELAIAHHVGGQQKRERIERFYREAKAAGALNHVNIVTIYEVGHANDRHFIAMEYLDGPSLREILQQSGPLPVKEVLLIALQMCEALGYAHSKGVVHRDVKPDNVHIIPPSNTAKLTDFGIARMMAEPSITTAGQVFGTPSYMSPEQLASRNVDHRTDIFSLGIMMFEAIAGKKPFAGDNIVSVTYNIMNTEVTYPPTIPKLVVPIIDRALAKDPDLRYQTMRLMASDIQVALAAIDSAARASASAAVTGIPTKPPIAVDPDAPTRMISPDMLSGAGSTVPPGYQPRTNFDQGNVLTGRPGPPITVRPLQRQEPDSDQIRSMVTLIVSVVCLVALLGVVAWAIANVYSAYKYSEQQAEIQNDLEFARQASANGDQQTAIEWYNKAMKIARPGSDDKAKVTNALSNSYAQLAASASSNGNTDTAINNYQQSLAVDQGNAQAHYNLAQLYGQQGETDKSLNEYASAAHADPMGDIGRQARDRASSGYLSLGEQDLRLGNVAKARTDWQNVDQVDPGSANAHEAAQRIQALSDQGSSGDDTGNYGSPDTSGSGAPPAAPAPGAAAQGQSSSNIPSTP
jgi:serine/threonine-protein kinase